MVTPHIHGKPPPVERFNRTGNGRPALQPVEKLDDGMLNRLREWVRKNAVLAAVSAQVMAFHDWISDPPMTERDRNKLYVVETRKASKRRRLVGR